jgi:hypothetical protein
VKRFIHTAAGAGLAAAYFMAATILLLGSLFAVVPGPPEQAIDVDYGHSKDLSINVTIIRQHVPLVREVSVLPALCTDREYPEEIEYTKWSWQLDSEPLPFTLVLPLEPPRGPPVS